MYLYGLAAEKLLIIFPNKIIKIFKNMCLHNLLRKSYFCLISFSLSVATLYFILYICNIKYKYEEHFSTL